MPVVNPLGYIHTSRIARLHRNSLDCLSGLLGESVRVWMDTGHMAPGLKTLKEMLKKWVFPFLLLTFPLIQPSLFLTPFLPKVHVNEPRSVGLYGEAATSSRCRLSCSLGRAHLERGRIWYPELWYPESDLQCRECDILGLQVGEAGSTRRLSAGPVTSFGLTKRDKTTGRLNVSLQFLTWIRPEHNTKSKCRASRSIVGFN